MYLDEEIGEILILTIYNATFGQGKTAYEIKTWQDRALNYYFQNTEFYTLVNSQLSAIMDAIKKHEYAESSMDLGIKK